MTNARITVANAIDLTWCTITSTIAPTATFPLSFLQNMDRDKFCRIPAGASIDIKLTWGGESVLANMVSLNRINAEPADTVKILGYTATDWTGTDLIAMSPEVMVDSLTLGDLAFGVDPLGSNLFDSFMGQKMYTKYFTEQLFGSMIIRIDATSNAQAVFDMARLWIGKSYELETNPVYGQGLIWNHNGIRNKRSKGGGPMNMRGSAWREMSFDMKSIIDADADMWFAAARLLQESQDFHFSLYPDVAGNTFTAAQIRKGTGLWIFEKMPGVIASTFGRSDSSTLIVET